MNTTALVSQFQLLPTDAQQQVIDFVEFLVLKYRGIISTQEEFTQEEKEVLLRLWEEYDRNPEDVLTLEEAEIQTKARYGI